MGRFAFKGRDDYLRAVMAPNALIAAIRKADSCESCTIATAVDRRCYKCKISCQDGSRTDGPEEHKD